MNKKLYTLLLFVILLNVGCNLTYLETKDKHFYEEAKELYSTGAYREATEAFESFLNEYPWSKEYYNASYYLSKSYSSLAELSSTEAEVDSLLKSATKALDSIPFDSDLGVSTIFERGYIWYLRISLADKDTITTDTTDSTIAYLNEVLQNYPGHSKADNALLYKANWYRLKADTVKALELYELLRQKYPQSSSYDNALFETAYTRYKQSQFDSTILYMTQLYNELPLSSKADNAALYSGHSHRNLSALAVADKDYVEGQAQIDSAMIWYHRVINEYENSGAYDNALYEIGDYYYIRRFQQNKKDSAISYLTSYCDIADTGTTTYGEALQKLMAMGVLYEK